MTGKAAFGPDCADHALAHVVALDARDLGFDDVDAVAAHPARGQPRALHVQPTPVRPFARAFTAATGEGDRQQQREEQRQGVVTTTDRHRRAA